MWRAILLRSTMLGNTQCESVGRPKAHGEATYKFWDQVLKYATDQGSLF
jgi:hypothetical protein